MSPSPDESSELNRNRPVLFFAGQIAGVEGYTESIAMGLLVGIHLTRVAQGLDPIPPPRETALGSLVHYICHAESRDFQPANITFDLLPQLEAGDILIDGGNSYYVDDIRRAKELAPKIHYVDVGTSGGVWGLERGYCMMIGGPVEAVKRLDPIFKALAPGQGNVPPTKVGTKVAGGTAVEGYLHCGPAGSGHFVKMVHNGIEYGIMQAYS